jgi:hypothetical protein
MNLKINMPSLMMDVTTALHKKKKEDTKFLAVF